MDSDLTFDFGKPLKLIDPVEKPYKWVDLSQTSNMVKSQSNTSVVLRKILPGSGLTLTLNPYNESPMLGSGKNIARSIIDKPELKPNEVPLFFHSKIQKNEYRTQPKKIITGVGIVNEKNELTPDEKFSFRTISGCIYPPSFKYSKQSSQFIFNPMNVFVTLRVKPIQVKETITIFLRCEGQCLLYRFNTKISETPKDYSAEFSRCFPNFRAKTPFLWAEPFEFIESINFFISG